MTPSRPTYSATPILTRLLVGILIVLSSTGCPRGTEKPVPAAAVPTPAQASSAQASSAPADAGEPAPSAPAAPRAAVEKRPTQAGSVSEDRAAQGPSHAEPAQPAGANSARAAAAESGGPDRARVATRFLPAFGHVLEGLATRVLVEPETGRASLYACDVQRYEFAIRRARTQGATRPGLFGAGWRSDLDARVEASGEGYLVTRLRGERRFVPTDAVPQGYVSETGDVELLIETEEGFQLRDHLGRTFRFDAEGRLSGIVPEFVLTRSEERLALRALADDSSCELTLDAEGRVASGVFRAPGQPERSLRYGYEGGELVSVSREVAGLTGETGYVVEEGRIRSVREDGREVLRFEHDAEGRIARLVDGEWVQTYAYSEGRAQVTTPAGSWDLRYAGQPAAPTRWELSAPDQDEAYAIDGRGRLLIPDAMPRDTIAPERPLRRRAAPAAEAGRQAARPEPQRELVPTAEGGTRRTVGVPGAQLIEERDAAGRLVARTTPDGRTERYAYSQEDEERVVRKTDSAGEVTEFRYRGERLISVETPEGRRWTFGEQERREDGSRVRVVDGPGGKQRFTHDAQGRLVERAFATGETVRFGYDAAGEPASALGSDGSGFRNEYREGRLVARVSAGLREELSAQGGVLTVKSPDATLRYSFGEGQEVLESDFGRFVQREVGRTLELESPAGAFHFGYDDQGQRRTLSYPGGVTLSWSYDGLGRVEEQRLERKGEALLTLGASWDERNERRVERRDGAAARYAYDERGRLESARLPSGTTRRYAYDDDGNRVEEVRGGAGSRETRSGLYDRRGRLVSWGEETLRYDAAGRLLQRGQTRYGYNACGQLTSVQRPGQPTLHYAYDSQGHRVERRRGQAVTRFVWDDDRLLAELGPGERTRVYVYGPGRDLPLAYCEREGEGPGEWIYLVANERHDVVAYLSAEGELCDAASFLPFGELDQAPAAGRPVFFAGKLVDRETGLVHMGRRDYCPDLGRFLTPDPSGLHGGLNAYVYVSNRPLECVDPSGLSEEPSLWRTLWKEAKQVGGVIYAEGRRAHHRSRLLVRRTLERVAEAGEDAHDLLREASGIDTKGVTREFVKDAGDTYGAASTFAKDLGASAWKKGKKVLRNIRDSGEGALHILGKHPDSESGTAQAAKGAAWGDFADGSAHDRFLGIIEYPAKAADLYLQVTNPLLHRHLGNTLDLRRYAFHEKEMDYGREFFLGSAEVVSLLIPAGGPVRASGLALRAIGSRALAAFGKGGARQVVAVVRTNLARQGGRALAGAKGMLRAGAAETFSMLGDKLVHPAFSLASGLSVATLRRALPGLGRLLTRSGSRQLQGVAEGTSKAGARASSVPPARAQAKTTAGESATPQGPRQEGMLAALKDPVGRKGGSPAGRGKGSPETSKRKGADRKDEPKGDAKGGKPKDEGCFLAGTRVMTAEGPRPIETIRVGQWVLSRDEVSRRQAMKRVVRLFRGQTDQVVTIRVAAGRPSHAGRDRSSGDEDDSLQTLRCTTEHPFWVEGRGFVPAAELEAGQRGLDSAGREVTYVSVEVRDERAAHFNFEVEDFHTYFVSETENDPAVWVHNKCFSRRDAAELLARSEGRSPGGRVPVGHPRTHIPDEGVAPAVHAAKFPNKPLNTFYRSKAQAERDLREVLNTYRQKLASLRPGQSFKVDNYKLQNPRQGFESLSGAEPTPVGFDTLFVKFYRTHSGDLHLQTMFPKDASPFTRIP